MPSIYKVSIPEYTLDQKPDYKTVGQKIDAVIKSHFSGQKVALRYLSLRDHPGLSVDDLTKIITESGTDRYDPNKKMSVAHDFYAEKGVELFAVPITVTDDLNTSEETIELFYEGTLADRGYSLRIDLVTIYDLDQLEAVPITYDNGDIGEGDYKFKFSDRKAESVLGILQIL